jgi:hypothetical protein
MYNASAPDWRILLIYVEKSLVPVGENTVPMRLRPAFFTSSSNTPTLLRPQA